MLNTKQGVRIHTIRGIDYLTEGRRIDNMTVQRHYQVEYPQDLN